jgi:hypothetical protein
LGRSHAFGDLTLGFLGISQAPVVNPRLLFGRPTRFTSHAKLLGYLTSLLRLPTEQLRIVAPPLPLF